jgi:hypothetical protein
MAQAVSRRLLTAEAQARARITPRGICGGQSDTGINFPPSLVSPCQYHSTVAGDQTRSVGKCSSETQFHSISSPKVSLL